MNYFKELALAFSKIKVNDSKSKALSLDNAILKITGLIRALDKKVNKIIFIGNGGSASIASHMVTDFLKNAKIPALTFNDPSLITCLSNDLGYEYIFAKPIEVIAGENDILFAISSSGESKNILNAVKKAKEKDCFVVTLSGFSPNNPLRQAGNINFYVPANSYGHVETTHLIICHCIADNLMQKDSDG